MNPLLLCELHAHTTWSDGHLTLPQLVDLYGESGFDVLCVTEYTAADVTSMRPTRRIARELETFRPLVHRYELFNRSEVFSWIAEERLPPVASGDVHRADHMPSWKTLLPCEKEPRAVVDYLRSNRRVCLMPFALEQHGALSLGRLTPVRHKSVTHARLLVGEYGSWLAPRRLS